MVTAGYVFNQVRALVDDQGQEWADDSYITTFLQMAQDDLVMKCMRDPNIGQIKGAVTLANVAAGTQSLATELLPAGHLALLSDPIELREKRSGDQDINYIQMIPKGVPVIQSTQNSLNRYYTFTGSDILLPGANQALDIWVWGSFKPAPIADENSPLIIDTETILKYGTAKLIALSRGNDTKMKTFAAFQVAMESDWMRTLYKIIQSIRVVNRPWRPKTNFWFSDMFLEGGGGAGGVDVGSINFVDEEIPSGAFDGINNSFIWAHVPQGLRVYYFANGSSAGVLWRDGIEYTLANAIMTTAFAPNAGDSIVGFYRY